MSSSSFVDTFVNTFETNVYDVGCSTMNYYLTIPVITNVIILTMAQDVNKIFERHPAKQGIGNVLDTLYGVSEISCAVSCMTAGVCTSCNMMSMEDGKYCQLMGTINRTIVNANSIMYGKNNLNFTDI